MKITTLIHLDPMEVEVEVTAEHILNALEEDPDKIISAAKIINRAAVVISSVSDELISEMSPGMRGVILKFLKDQAARFDI